MHMKKNVFLIGLFLVSLCFGLSSCSLDDDMDDSPYSKRSFEKTYALVKDKIGVDSSGEYILSLNKDYMDSLRINPAHISQIENQLMQINQQIKASLDDPNCLYVIMSVSSGSYKLTKDALVSVNNDNEISTKGSAVSRASTVMQIGSGGGYCEFTGAASVKTEISISPGWAGPYSLSFSCSTGRLQSGGGRYIMYSGSSYFSNTNWWNSDAPNGNNTKWKFSAAPLSGGASGSAYISW